MRPLGDGHAPQAEDIAVTVPSELVIHKYFSMQITNLLDFGIHGKLEPSSTIALPPIPSKVKKKKVPSR